MVKAKSGLGAYYGEELMGGVYGRIL